MPGGNDGKGNTLTITLSGTDICGDNLTFTVQSGPSFGTLGPITQIDASSASVTYTPNSGFEGSDAFYFSVSNCGFSSGPSIVTILVVPGPTLATVECRPRSLVLRWTLPEWLTAASTVHDFRIYRCAVASGTCTPDTAIYATVDGAPNTDSWSFSDSDVQPGTVYCYRITFRKRLGDSCPPVTFPESPFSNIECSTTCCPSTGQDIWVDYGPTPQQLAEWIMGPGFTVNNAVYTGADVARGTFGNGTAAGFPINTGVILSSGDIGFAKGPNNRSDKDAVNLTGPDAGLESLVPGLVTHDAAVLEFDIVSPVARNLVFEYIFASEEYPEYFGEYNDVMAIFVDEVNVPQDEVNIAPVPGTGMTVSANTINGGFDGAIFDVPATNPEYYVDNADPGFSALPPYAAQAPVYNIQYDGTTVKLNAQTSISANVTYHIKIAIADATDFLYDSAIFIKAQVPCP